MTDIVAFLEARLAEDAVLIERNSHGNGLDDGFPDYRTYDDSDTRAADDYIRHFNPNRSAAEVAAKRALLEWCVEATKHLDWSGIDTFGWLKDDPNPRGTHSCQLALRTLAAPYADHPDFNPAWKIDG